MPLYLCDGPTTNKSKQFRSSRSTRAGPQRGHTDNDTLDGLPIRQWRKQDSIIGASEATNNITDAPSRGVGIWKELPMPEGSANYPLHSQQILRAARAGNILKSQEIIRNLYRKTGGDDDKEVEADDGVEGANEDAKRGVKRSAQGFQVKKWSQLARQQEESFPEYLAPRRAGLPSIHRIPIVNPNNMRQTRVRRVDATNQPVIYEVLIAEGKTIDGEATETLMGDDELVVKPPPGTLITGLGVANEHGIVVLAEAPVPLFGRGRPPPPRGKGKGKRGPGRGKKKVDFGRVPNTVDITGGAATSTSGIATSVGDVVMGNAPNENGGTTPAVGEGDGDGEDEGEDGEDDEDDEEGEDGEVDADAEGEHDDDREEGELTPSTGPELQDAPEVLKQFKSPEKKVESLSSISQQPTSTEPGIGREDQVAMSHMSHGDIANKTQPESVANLPAMSEPKQPPAPYEQPQQPMESAIQQPQQHVASKAQEPFRIPGLSLATPPIPQPAPASVVSAVSKPETTRTTNPVPPEVDLFGSLERGLQAADDDREEGEIE